MLDPTRVIAERLVADGAVFAFAAPAAPILVGDLRWSDPDAVLIFAGNGDRVSDTHFVRYDEALPQPDGSVEFVRAGSPAGRLQRIATATVEDPDDYRIGWQLWQCVAPLRRKLIERCFDEAEQRARTNPI